MFTDHGRAKLHERRVDEGRGVHTRIGSIVGAAKVLELGDRGGEDGIGIAVW